MKNVIVLLSVLTLTSAVFAADKKSSDLRASLQKIADNADVGNGGAEVKTYDMKSFDQKKALASDLADVKKEFAECGPFKTTIYRRGTINAIKNMEKRFDGDEPTINALTALYKQGKIAKMHSIELNSDIECSRLWVEVYTTEGLLLEIYYGMND